MSKLIGSKAFYKRVLLVTVPIMLQNCITNFVGLLDNIMVGRMGTEQLSGVAIANQLLFVFNLAVFGALSGAGIFTAQFHGAEDHKGVRATMRYKLISTFLILAIAVVLLISKGDALISLYLNESEGGNVALTLQEGRKYLNVMLFGLPAFALSQSYASTLRETGETVLPMKAGVVAVFVNLVLNYILIFGNFGAPRMGVQGAALATVISRYVETGMIMIVSHRHKDQYRFVERLYHSMRIPLHLVKEITIKGMPLMVNELLWAVGSTTIMQSYSLRGLNAVAALNINSTIFNLFSTIYFAMGSCIAIIVGQLLGAGKAEEAKDTDTKLIFFSVCMSAGVGLVTIFFAPLITGVYNTSDAVKNLATQLIRVSGLCMPLYSFVHCCYFTMRTGGKTIVTFLFDCAFMWVCCIPVAFLLARLTGLPVVQLYLAVQLMDLVKAIIGFILVKKGVWVNNIVADSK